jgi:hypothetical protein
LPPGIWPPIEVSPPGEPEHPITLPPGVWPPPARPAHPIARPPHIPPGSVWPPVNDGHPSHPIVPAPPDGKLWVAAILGVTGSGAYRWGWAAVDIPPARPDAGLPPTEATPRR